MTDIPQRLYRIEDAAQQLGFALSTMKQYISTGKIGCEKDEHGNILGLSQEQVESFKERTALSRKPKGLSVPKREEDHQQEARLLQDIVASVFTFLGKHSLSGGIHSLQETTVNFRLWKVKTASGVSLRVISDNGHISILSDTYQKQLEEEKARLQQELRAAQALESAPQQKREIKTLTDYAYPLDVILEPHDGGFLCWCKDFTAAARGKTEEEALAAFHQVLSGYRRQLYVQNTKLSGMLLAEFQELQKLEA